MPAAKKKTTRKKTLKKRSNSTVFVAESRISAKDTLFPEKVAQAKKILRNANFNGSGFGG